MASLLSLALAFSLSLSVVHARDLGVHGALFPIVEESLIDVIQKYLAKSSSPLSEEVVLQVKEVARHPRSHHLPMATSYRSWTYDPSITISREIQDAEGHTIVRAGERVNPLDYVSLDEPLLFFDGENREQIAWALAEPLGKWILVAGSPMALSEEIGREVFFDQGEAWVAKFKIQALPARAAQQGRLLLIEEIALGGRS
jgi:conjugal transfer pilus assembly protein TraW